MRYCNRCVMNDANDNYIHFDEDGICNYCSDALNRMKSTYFPNEIGKKKLEVLLKKIKTEQKNKKYDCIMGLSGGLDSSYLLYLGHKWGLRILVIHIDDGFDTEISKSNIKKIINKTGFDYEIIRPNEEQYNDLILSYMKAGVPNIAIPQDNILFAFLYKKMKEYKIKYFLSGGNFSLESILQKSNTYKSNDVVNIIDIHNKYGKKPINDLVFISTIKKRIDYFIYGIKSPRPLNYIDYDRDRAFKELHDFCEFQYYGSKHLENIFTAFVQLYWLPKKFGVDKRNSHLSSMIISGQITRQQALEILKKPMVDEKLINEYIEIIKKKFELTDEDFDSLMNSHNHQHPDFKTEDQKVYYKIFNLFEKIIRKH